MYLDGLRFETTGQLGVFRWSRLVFHLVAAWGDANLPAEVKVGILFLAFLLLAVAVGVYLTGQWGWLRGQHLTVHFHNVEGLTPGARVLFAGMEIGRVISIGLATEDDLKLYPGRPIVVHLSVRPDVELKSTDEFVITQSGLLGDTQISVRRPADAERRARTDLLGTPQQAPRVLVSGDHVVGMRSPGVTELTDDARAVLQDVQTALSQLTEVYTGPDVRERLPAILANVEQATRHATEFTQTLARVSLANEGRIGRIAQEIVAAAGHLNRSARRVQQLTATSAPQIEGATARVAKMINTSAGNVQAASRDLQLTARRVEQMVNSSAAHVETSTRLVQETLAQTTGSMKRTVQRVEEMVQASADDVEATTRAGREALVRTADSLERSSATLERLTQRVETLVNQSATDIEATVRAGRQAGEETAAALRRTAQVVEETARKMGDDAGAVTARARELIDKAASNVERSAFQVEQATTRLAQLLQQVSQDVGASSRRVQEMVQTSATNVETASANLATLSAQLQADLAATLGRASAALDVSAANIQRSTDRVARMVERSADDIERTTRRIHDMLATSPLPQDLSAAAASIRRSAENIEQVTQQIRGTAESPNIADQVRATARNLETASEHLVAVARQGEQLAAAGTELLTEGREAVAKLTATATEEAIWADLRATVAEARKAMEDLSALSQHIRGLLTDPAVTEDLTASISNVRQLTEQSIGVIEKADRSLTRVDHTMDRVQEFTRQLVPTLTTGYASLEAVQDFGLRADLVADFFFGGSTTDYWRVGLRDLGDAESLIFQRGFTLGGASAVRLGILGNEPGIGFDRQLTRNVRLELDLWNPDSPRLDMRGLQRVGEGWDVLLGATEVFSGTEPFLGARWSFGGHGAEPKLTPARRSP